jgi:hypothetical protein
MFTRVKFFVLAMAVLTTASFWDSPAHAAKPQPKRTRSALRSRAGFPVLYAYGFAPYLYYESYGFGGIQGAPNSNPAPYGFGDVSVGSSEIPFGTSSFSFGATDFGN